MAVKLALFLSLSLFSLLSTGEDKQCYWNENCLYELFGTVTPYDKTRGDLRDQIDDSGCNVLSIWSLHRHGNRNPKDSIVRDISALQTNIKRLLHDAHTQLRYERICAQDLEDLLNWRWNSTIESTPACLTGVGYEEMYGIGRRIYAQYKNFLQSLDKVQFRATDEQRTVASLTALLHGMTEGTNLLTNFTLGIQPSLEQDDVLRPYKNCQRYQDEIIVGQLPASKLAAYDSSPVLATVRDYVQARLPVDYQLKTSEMYTLYELCRFDSSWSKQHRSPWCSLFQIRHEYLVLLQFRDDIRHYYKNGYGSQINLKLGALPLKDLYENFVNAAEGKGKTLVSYLTHDSMLDMMYCALGLYNDSTFLESLEALSDPRANVNNLIGFSSRAWMTSKFAAFASNFIAVLSRCDESGEQTLRVRLFINEKPTHLCPEVGCTWEQFVDLFKVFSEANLDFCNKENSGTAAFLTGCSNTNIGMATSYLLLPLVLSSL